MPLDASLVGRVGAPSPPYEVGREKIREFADAIGEADPVCRDPRAARAAGYLDVIAPPTFAVVFTWLATSSLVAELGIELSRLVHGEQRFELRRPVRAGDRLVTSVHVDGVRAMAGNTVLAVRCEVVDEAGDPVLTTRATLLVRGTGPS